MFCLFNGKPLPNGVHLTEFNISTPQVQRRTIDIPDVRGLIRTGGKLGNRAVTLTYVMLADSITERMELWGRLVEWCKSDGPAPLILPGMGDRFLTAECQTFPNDVIGQWDEEDIVFQCDVPEFQSVREKHATLQGGTNTVRIGGNLTTPVTLTLTVPALSSPTFMIGGHAIEFGDLEAGRMIIDTERATVTLDGDDIAMNASLGSDLRIFLDPGANTVILPAGVTGTIAWRDRWL